MKLSYCLLPIEPLESEALVGRMLQQGKVPKQAQQLHPSDVSMHAYICLCTCAQCTVHSGPPDAVLSSTRHTAKESVPGMSVIRSGTAHNVDAANMPAA